MSKSVQACFGTAPRWEDRGVTCPAIEGFGYEVDAGLLRTPIASAYARQRRRYTSRPTGYQLTWRLDTGQLNALEALVQSDGYKWIYVPAVTGQVDDWMAVDHLIRFTSNLQVRCDAEDSWTATIQAEQYKIDTKCINQ
jgi:hypothetical protein